MFKGPKNLQSTVIDPKKYLRGLYVKVSSPFWKIIIDGENKFSLTIRGVDIRFVEEWSG